MESDENHKRALEIATSTIEKGVTSKFVLFELFTFIKKWESKEKVGGVWERLSKSDIKLVDIDFQELDDCIGILVKYDELSFCDASNIIIMKKYGLANIISFDSDFDLVPGIERIY